MPYSIIFLYPKLFGIFILVISYKYLFWFESFIFSAKLFLNLPTDLSFIPFFNDSLLFVLLSIPFIKIKLNKFDILHNLLN